MAKATGKKSSARTTAKKPATKRRVAVIPKGLPKELVPLARKYPFLKLKLRDGLWHGEVSISEKRRNDQARMNRGHEAACKILNKKPWVCMGASRAGYDGQFDTGGNFSSTRCDHVHASGLRVTLYEGVSFATGTYTWSLSAWMPSGRA